MYICGCLHTCITYASCVFFTICKKINSDKCAMNHQNLFVIQCNYIVNGFAALIY